MKIYHVGKAAAISPEDQENICGIALMISVHNSKEQLKISLLWMILI